MEVAARHAVLPRPAPRASRPKRHLARAGGARGDGHRNAAPRLNGSAAFWRHRCWRTAPSSIIAALSRTGRCMRRSRSHASTLARALLDWRTCAPNAIAPATRSTRQPQLPGSLAWAFTSTTSRKRPGRVVLAQSVLRGADRRTDGARTCRLARRGAERVRDTAGSSPYRRRPAGRARCSRRSRRVGSPARSARRGCCIFAAPTTIRPCSRPSPCRRSAAALLGARRVRPNRSANRVTRWWLRLTAALGFGGVGFHAYGVSRNMGGWRNWSQNVLNGPPLPAPPSFTGLALAGLAALSFWRTKPMADRYPGYDVLKKRNSPSWNEQTRRVIDRAPCRRPQRAPLFHDEEWPALRALRSHRTADGARSPARRSQPWSTRSCSTTRSDGYRYAALPPMREAWRRGLAALDAEAQMR